MDIIADPPPRGFHVTAADDGAYVIAYRTTGMGRAAAFFVAGLSLCTLVCAAITAAEVIAALNHRQGPTLLLVALVWSLDLFIFAYTVWYFRSVTWLRFGPDDLLVERRLSWYCRRRTFRRGEVAAVRQVKDGGMEDDSFPSWALAVVASTEVRVLSRQPMAQCRWLGQLIARWAGLELEQCEHEAAKACEVL